MKYLIKSLALTSFFAVEAVASAQVSAPVAIKNTVINFVDVSPATEISAGEIAKSKMNQLYIQGRDSMIVERVYSYSTDIYHNNDLRLWNHRTTTTYRGMKTVEVAFPESLEWLKESWPAAANIEFNWFSTGEGEIELETIKSSLDKMILPVKNGHELIRLT